LQHGVSIATTEGGQIGPLERYRQRVSAGDWQADPAQYLAVEKLQLLANRLSSYTPPARTDWFSYFTRRRGEVPRGLYIVGGVGLGKTMLMDMFFEAIEFAPKRRVHFHAFMADVHARIRAARADVPGDPLPVVAAAIAGEAALLCLDEMQVGDIGDAMILGRLFEGLFAHQVVIVATSNTLPRELYGDGLNRELFLPFIALIEDKMEVLQLEAAKDYRLAGLADRTLYFSPLGAAASQAIDLLWQRLTGGARAAPINLDVAGHALHVPLAVADAARFRFGDLCDRPLGAGDYLRVARRFQIVFIEDIPVLSPEMASQARRFVHLIDTLYDARVCLVASAAAEPHALWLGQDEADRFARTASRLMEMRSLDYRAGLEGKRS